MNYDLDVALIAIDSFRCVNIKFDTPWHYVTFYDYFCLVDICWPKEICTPHNYHI